MKERTFICVNCGYKFTKLVYEDGEAEATNRPFAPVTCPKCGSQNVKGH